jgi:hypothetical protein
MWFNAYILDWAMNDYAQLKQELADANFAFAKEGEKEHIRVAVPFGRVKEFGSLCQTHLNSPYNYVDIQYPNEKKTVIIFQQDIFMISSQEENEKVKRWAISLGLPPEQADWSTSF